MSGIYGFSWAIILELPNITGVHDSSQFNATLFLRIPTFQVSRDEAEAILANAKEGEFLLSQDISSERFISVWYVMGFHVLWS